MATAHEIEALNLAKKIFEHFNGKTLELAKEILELETRILGRPTGNNIGAGLSFGSKAPIPNVPKNAMKTSDFPELDEIEKMDHLPVPEPTHNIPVNKDFDKKKEEKKTEELPEFLNTMIDVEDIIGKSSIDDLPF